MPKLILFVLFLLPSTISFGQQVMNESAADGEAQKIDLFLNLQALKSDSQKLATPLARAAAQAEIADAAWRLNPEWAKPLLREAYELTFPSAEVQARLRERAVGAIPIPPTSADRANNAVRQRILEIASRDKGLLDELLQLGAEKLGSYEKHLRYVDLASQAIGNGDKEAAGDYILKAIEADPTQIGSMFIINEVAARDRAAADRLILEYLDQLRRFPLARENQSTLRTMFLLGRLLFPSAAAQQSISPPGPAVMKAYVTYVLDTVGKMDQEGLRRSRLWLLGVWEPLKQYAPELTGTFMDLETRSRMPGERANLPTRQSNKESSQENYERRLKDAIKSEHPDEQIIYAAISRGDFTQARKLIDKLPDGPQKTQFTDAVNTQEALALAAKGDLPAAQRLAAQLTRATSIQQVYPVLLAQCRATKDVGCASLLVFQALKQLKRADVTPPIPPAGIPASVFDTPRALDPVVVSAFKLAAAVLPLNEALGFEVLAEAVQLANASVMETAQGRTGFDAATFAQFAAKDEGRTRQAAETFKDPLRRIVALAAIYRRQTEALTKRATKEPKPAAQQLKPAAVQP